MSDKPTLEDLIVCGRCPLRPFEMPTLEELDGIILEHGGKSSAALAILELFTERLTSVAVLRQHINPNG